MGSLSRHLDIDYDQTEWRTCVFSRVHVIVANDTAKESHLPPFAERSTTGYYPSGELDRSSRRLSWQRSG